MRKHAARLIVEDKEIKETFNYELKDVTVPLRDEDKEAIQHRVEDCGVCL